MVMGAREVVKAVVLPGGTVVVFTGILPVAADENGLATVLAHEVAHVVADHAGEKLTSSVVWLVVSELLGLPVLRLVNSVLLQSTYSRAMESEADYIGLVLMRRAAYDPEVAVALWERMDADGVSQLAPVGKAPHRGHPELAAHAR